MANFHEEYTRFRTYVNQLSWWQRLFFINPKDLPRTPNEHTFQLLNNYLNSSFSWVYRFFYPGYHRFAQSAEVQIFLNGQQPVRLVGSGDMSVYVFNPSNHRTVDDYAYWGVPIESPRTNHTQCSHHHHHDHHNGHTAHFSNSPTHHHTQDNHHTGHFSDHSSHNSHSWHHY